MANTFTGLKLQGQIGKFGAKELSDIEGQRWCADKYIKLLTNFQKKKMAVWSCLSWKMQMVLACGSNCYQLELIDKGMLTAVAS